MLKAVAGALLAAAILTQIDQAYFYGRHVDAGLSFGREIQRGFGF
jgi:hypothetical protein